MKKKILLMGETCLDIFQYGKCNRLNPEAPTPVFTPTYKNQNFGMAANVRLTMEHIGLDVTMLTNSNNKIIKHRYVDEDSNYILLRVDNEDELEPITMNRLKEIDFGSYDAVVISDYDKGLLDEHIMENIFILCEGKTPTFLDTKKKIGDWASSCKFIKINKKEYNNPKHYNFLVGKNMEDKLIVTLGKDGCMYRGENFKTKEVSVMDVVGAGDTFMAGLVYGVLHLDNMKYSIQLANNLARDVVSKRGVVLPDSEIIRKFYNSF